MVDLGLHMLEYLIAFSPEGVLTNCGSVGKLFNSRSQFPHLRAVTANPVLLTR